MSELKPCDKDVFERGTVLCIFEGTSEEAEEFCKERTKHTGHKHDWHTFAGRKVVKYLATEPDTIQVSRAEYEALRRDAERYRWLRGEHDVSNPLAAVCWKRNADRSGHDWVNTVNADSLDRSIDAAIGGER